MTHLSSCSPLSKMWLLVIASYVFIASQTTGGSVVVTPFCENATVNNNEKGLRELLSAVKSNRPQMVLMLTSRGVDLNMKTDSDDSLLHVAVMCASTEVTRTLLKLGLDPNVRGNSGLTPMYRATEMNDVPTMKELQEKGAEINVRSGTADDSLLHVACRKSHAEAAEWLLQSKLDPDIRNKRSETPLHYCAGNSNQEVLRLLVNKGASVNARDEDGDSPLHVAASKGHLRSVRYLAEMGAKVRAISNIGVTPLHKAAEFGHPLVADELIKRGAQVNVLASSAGVSPLHLGVYNYDVVKNLIIRGADVNLKNHNGAGPLHWASSGSSPGQEAIVNELIVRGADVNSVMRNGWSPLHISCLHGLKYIVEVLLELGASVDTVDTMGRTPLHYAASNGNQHIVRLLISKGAKVDVIDEDGDSPHTWATNRGHKDLANILHQEEQNQKY